MQLGSGTIRHVVFKRFAISYPVREFEMQTITDTYWQLHLTQSDINQHLPALASIASNCSSVFETGVRGVVSSYALAHGLLNNGLPEKFLLLNDLTPCPVQSLYAAAADTPLTIEHIWGNNLQLSLHRSFDFIFIDTWHVYPQLRRELEMFSPLARKYIALHDTTLDAVQGESIRMGMDIDRQVQESGFPRDEICRGLWPAVEEFLAGHGGWKLVVRLHNNNGFTVLARDGYESEVRRALSFLPIA